MLRRAASRLRQHRAPLDPFSGLELLGITRSAAPAASASLGAHGSSCACSSCLVAGHRSITSSSVANAAAEAQPDFYNVPLGHLKSDLSSEACHIGLNRRRDLSLRSDLYLTAMDGTKSNIREWLADKNVVVVGIPNGGTVCVGEHLPGYDKLAEDLKSCDIHDVICVMVGDVSEVKAVADKSGSKLTFAADTNGGFTRLLGLDLSAPGESGPRSQRYAGIVENGILVKLKVEKKVGEVTVSGCERILELLQCKQEAKRKLRQ